MQTHAQTKHTHAQAHEIEDYLNMWHIHIVYTRERVQDRRHRLCVCTISASCRFFPIHTYFETLKASLSGIACKSHVSIYYYTYVCPNISVGLWAYHPRKHCETCTLSIEQCAYICHIFSYSCMVLVRYICLLDEIVHTHRANRAYFNTSQTAANIIAATSRLSQMFGLFSSK